ncbi:hypothetical protein [Niveispirillum irakense]|uniref:hypothetical protein n=1 Tax=Niveispirillum irakense TaxID=34011 RepID=UPI0012B5E2B0|nr:hypothetical protein [Niveispirillum irakense]
MEYVEFKKCAEKYLNNRWVGIEKSFIEKMNSSINESILNEIAASFIISRQFPRRSSSDRNSDFSPVIAPLSQAIDGVSHINIIARVEKMADDLRAIPGLVKHNAAGNPDRPISACSKFIWCGRPDVGVIYDRRARTFLRKLGHSVPDGDYGAYVRAFRAELSKRSEAISAVSSTYEPLLVVSGPLSAADWFPSKLLDLWLYSNGS